MSKTPVPAMAKLTAIPDVSLRSAAREDDEFIFELYASTRAEELAATGWDAPQRDAFLRMQFQARQTSYRSQFPAAQAQIILRRGERIGWWVVDRASEEIRLVNVALLPAHCGGGIGSALIAELLVEAAQTTRPVRLHVLKGNRAIGLYERFGFRFCGESDFYHQMEWRDLTKAVPPKP